MKILAVDGSKTSTGIAWLDTETGKLHLDTWKLGSEYSKEGDLGFAVHNKLDDFRQVFKIDHLFIESHPPSSAFSGKTNAKSVEELLEIKSHCLSFAKTFSIRRWPVLKTRWYPHFTCLALNTSKGPEQKKIVMARCKMLGLNPRNTDESDAIGILDYGCMAVGVMPFYRANEVLLPPLGMAQ